jgi:hypothetical protein
VEVHGHSNKQLKLKLKLSHKSCVQQQAAQAQPESLLQQQAALVQPVFSAATMKRAASKHTEIV